jgi:ABC-type amino acid transport substrate-binding protein
VKITKIIAAAAVLALSAVSAFGVESALKKDTLVVGTESTFPPFEFRSTDNQLQGYDIDLVEAIAKKLGKKVQWADMSFDGLLPSVMTHKIDMIAACMSATPARQKKVAFSDVTNHSESAFFVPAGKEQNDVSAFEGKTIATQLGTIQDAYAHAMKGVTVKNYQKTDDCLREVMYGRVDAALIDGPSGWKYSQSKDFAGKISMCCLVNVATESKGSAFGIAKDDPELLAAVDKALGEMKADGSFQALRDKWGLDDWKKNVK